jgi:hypothetical protein
MSQTPPQGQPSWLPPNQPPPGQPPAGKQPLWKRPWVIITVVVGALIVGLAGCITAVVVIANSSPTETTRAKAAPTTTTIEEPIEEPPESTIPEPETGKGPVGSTVDIAVDDEPAGTITVSKVQTATREPGEFGSEPEHDRFLIVHVRVEGIGEPFDINPLDFYIRGKDGSHTEDPTYSSAWGASLESGTLHKGEHLAGTLVYDISNAARHGQVVYSPNTFSGGDPVYEWTD